MPSIGGPMDRDAGRTRVDFVLGDSHGTSCAPRVTEAAETALKTMDYVVTRNVPYSGGFVTRHYGRPNAAIHALQIEINRSLYMDEARILRSANLSRIADQMRAVVAAVANLDGRRLIAE
jgi:N-formylglutamate amidohydrolase